MTGDRACYMVTHNYLSFPVEKTSITIIVLSTFGKHVFSCLSIWRKLYFACFFFKHEFVYFSQGEEHLSDTALPWHNSQNFFQPLCDTGSGITQTWVQVADWPWELCGPQWKMMMVIRLVWDLLWGCRGTRNVKGLAQSRAQYILLLLLAFTIISFR